MFGLERLVDLTIAKKVPQVAYGTTVGIRFTNNVIGECNSTHDQSARASGSLGKAGVRRVAWSEAHYDQTKPLFPTFPAYALIHSLSTDPFPTH